MSPPYFDKSTTMYINSYSEAKKLGNGRFIKSDRINAGGHSWRIVLYPNGRLAGTTASMSLFLLLDDDNAGGGIRTAAADEDVVRVKFCFVIGDWYDRSPVFMSSAVAGAFSRRSNAHGFERFVSREDFEKTALFKIDRFEIQCRLTVFPAASKRAAVQTSTSRSGRTDPSVVQAPPPSPAPPPKPSVAQVPPSSAAPPPPPTPTPSVVRARVPPAASPKPSVVTEAPPPAASPKPSVVTAAPPPASPAVPSVAMSSAPPTSVQPEQEQPVVTGTGVSASPASVPRAPPALSGLPADLGRLLATKEAADVDLEVRGKVFPAHKSVLAARSPVFMEELFGPAKEEDTSYVRIIPGICPEAFEAMLHYVYTDTLPPEMAMNSLGEGVMLAEDLLAAADRYDLKDLKLLVENKMCSHVGVSTALPMLVLAERHQCCKLKKMCLGFVGSCGNTRAVMATNGLEVLARSSPSVIKDVISEILDEREATRRRLINFCIFAFCFILSFLLFAIFS